MSVVRDINTTAAATTSTSQRCMFLLYGIVQPQITYTARMSDIKAEALYRELYTEDNDMFDSDQCIETDIKKPVETSVFSSYVNLTNSIIGSGVLGLLVMTCCGILSLTKC